MPGRELIPAIPRSSFLKLSSKIIYYVQRKKVSYLSTVWLMGSLLPCSGKCKHSTHKKAALKTD